MGKVSDCLLAKAEVYGVTLHIQYPNGTSYSIEVDPCVLMPHVNDGDYILNRDELADICIRVNEEIQNLAVTSEADKRRVCNIVFDKCNFRK